MVSREEKEVAPGEMRPARAARHQGAFKMYGPLRADAFACRLVPPLRHAKSDTASDTVVEIRHNRAAAGWPRSASEHVPPTRELKCACPADHTTWRTSAIVLAGFYIVRASGPDDNVVTSYGCAM
jgi:hypothetical protein